MALADVLAFEPDDGAGGAALDGMAVGLLVLRVVDHGQIVLDCDQAGGAVDHALAAGGAGHFAHRFGGIRVGFVAAGHPQLVRYRLQREQLFRADIHAVAAGRAFVGDHMGQTVLVHRDGIEVAHVGTVANAETAPGASLAPASGNRGGATG